MIGGDPEAEPEDLSDEMERLKAIREQAGLDDLVTFLGKRSQDTLPYYYSAAEAVVVPSHYESFGMVALEAMACGTPVVASQVGGLAFLVQDGVTGFTVPVDDPQALGEPSLAHAAGGPDSSPQARRAGIAACPPVRLGEHCRPHDRALYRSARSSRRNASIPR